MSEQAEVLMLTLQQARQVVRVLREHADARDLAFIERALRKAQDDGRAELLLVIKGYY